MNQILQSGGNLAIPSFSGTVVVSHAIDNKLDINLTAFLLTDLGKVQGDTGIIYYNQPLGFGGVASFIQPIESSSVKIHKINFDLNKTPTDITRIAVTLTEDSGYGFVAARNLTAEIRSGDEIIGSFHRYKVSMSIDNNDGTVVTITADNANKDDSIFTCVPGMILNTPNGIKIQPLELYSEPGSENRPKLIKGKDGLVEVIMDAGPKNDFK